MRAFNIISPISAVRQIPALAAAFLLGAVAGCILGAFLLIKAQGAVPGISGTVKRELPSPNGRLTAILTESTGHWTTSNVYYDVYVRVEKNGAIQHVFSVTNADDGAQIRWQNPDALVVHISCGDIKLYQNSYWYPLNIGFEPMFVGLEGNRICKYSNRDTPGI